MIGLRRGALSISILLAVIVLSVSTFGAFAYADNSVNEVSDLMDDEEMGYNLGEYDAEITYYSCTLNSSGFLTGFEVVFDKDFLLAIGEIENCVYHYPEIFKEMGQKFSALGYKVKSDEFGGQFSAMAQFDSLTDYYVATGHDGYEKNDDTGEKKKGFLFTDRYSSFETAFAGVGENENSVLTWIYDKCRALGAEEDKILFTFVYGTPYKVITSDADKVVYDASRKVYFHYFKMTSETKDRVIHLKNHSPNAWGFYLLAIIVAFGIAGVVLAVGIIRRRRITYGG